MRHVEDLVGVKCRIYNGVADGMLRVVFVVTKGQ